MAQRAATTYLIHHPTGSFSTYASANECGFDRNRIIMDKN